MTRQMLQMRVRFTTKSRKVRLAKEPMRILGGSPMSVAVPPTLEAKTSGINRVMGLTFKVTAISMVTGIISNMVVTLSKKAEQTAVTTMRIADRMKILPWARA
jgi:hypothetical protein